MYLSVFQVALYNTDQDGSDSPRSSLNNSLSDQSLASVNLNSVGSVHSYTPVRKGKSLIGHASVMMRVFHGSTKNWISSEMYPCYTDLIGPDPVDSNRPQTRENTYTCSSIMRHQKCACSWKERGGGISEMFSSTSWFTHSNLYQKNTFFFCTDYNAPGDQIFHKDTKPAAAARDTTRTNYTEHNIVLSLFMGRLKQIREDFRCIWSYY